MYLYQIILRVIKLRDGVLHSFVCNQYEKEHLVHILNVCPIYKALREVYLRDSIENVEHFWDISGPLNLQKLRSLYNFIGGALRLRSFIINE